MCGIAGILSAQESLVNKEGLQQMADSLRHRGPDGEGLYTGSCAGTHIGLAHRRLAITDPGDQHKQPLRYLDRFVVVHNGEIYNHAEIRHTLERQGYRFSTKGDTELIAAAYAFEGPACLQGFDGMFAFAIWDEREGTLFCARDRFGEKPFFYHWDPNTRTFSFASEMKALWAAGIARKIQPGMFLHFLTLGQTFHPDLPELSFYQDVFRLPPAHSLLFRPGLEGFEQLCYWDIDKENILDIGAEEATRTIRQLMEKGLTRRLQSVKPMGILVSGGIDSSSLLAAAEGMGAPLRDSLSTVFPGFDKDESPFIMQVNERFRLNPHLLEPSGEALANSMATLAWHQEEPFGSASAWAQYNVYGHAKKEGFLTMIDGQGADEILGGYERHIPWALREQAGEGRKRENKKPVSTVQNPESGEPVLSKQPDPGAGAEAYRNNGFHVAWDYRARITARFPGLTAAFLERRARAEHLRHPFIHPRFLEEHSGAGFIRKPLVRRLNDILYHDALQGPLQDLLRMADRNAMAHGVEARMPFLFHELAEFIFSLPVGLKMRGGWTKWILRECYRSSLPADILERKGKTGFEPPQQAWMSLPAAQESIRKAKQKLVDAGMLRSSVLHKPVIPEPAYARHPYEWRAWVAAQFV